MVNRLASLERRTSRGGKETIDHSPGAHEDVANVVAGVAHCAVNRCTVKVTELRILAALAIFSIAHRCIDLRPLGVSVDRVSYKDASAKQR